MNKLQPVLDLFEKHGGAKAWCQGVVTAVTPGGR